MTTFLGWGAVAVALIVAGFFAFTSYNDSEKQGTANVAPTVATNNNSNVPPNTPPTPPVVSPGGTLDLSDRGYTQVPPNTFTQTEIEKLDLSGNALSGALPAEIRFMQDLVSLDLSDNNFTGVPAEIGQLAKLEYLDLSDNPITGLPNELAKLSNLKTLDLRGTNYSVQDLEVIRNGLPASTVIRTD